MPFRNYSLTKGGQLTIGAIFSPDFETGVAGWRIKRDGSAEFNNAVFRGTVVATEFGAVVVVTAGTYSGTYDVVTGEFTDPFSNLVAAIQFTNETNPATVPPYIAAVNAPSAGAIMALSSGQATNTDHAAVLWLESAAASATGHSLVLFQADTFQPFGGSGPTLTEEGAGIAVDGWHAMTLQNGWTVGTGGVARYRLMLDNTVLVQLYNLVPGTITDGTAIWNIPAGYVPTSAAPWAYGVAINYTTAPAFGSAPEILFNSAGTMTCQNFRGTVKNFGAVARYGLT